MTCRSRDEFSSLLLQVWSHKWRRVSSKSHEWGQLIRGIWVDKRGADIPSVPIKGSRYRHYYFCSIWGPSIRDIHSNYRFVSHIVWNKEYEVHKLSTLSPASYDIICGWSPKHIRCDFFSLVVRRRRGATDSSPSSGASGRGSTPAWSSF